jgi:hypothetical protein
MTVAQVGEVHVPRPTENEQKQVRQVRDIGDDSGVVMRTTCHDQFGDGGNNTRETIR